MPREDVDKDEIEREKKTCKEEEEERREGVVWLWGG